MRRPGASHSLQHCEEDKENELQGHDVHLRSCQLIVVLVEIHHQLIFLALGVRYLGTNRARDNLKEKIHPLVTQLILRT